MKLSESIALQVAMLAAIGDVDVFIGDMKPLNEGYFDVVTTATDNTDEKNLYGDKYVHLGEW